MPKSGKLSILWSMKQKNLCLGIDIGSTTIKTAVINPDNNTLLFSEYARHNADQAATTLELLKRVKEAFPDASFKAAVCGSGGSTICQVISAFFIQEVVANSLVIREFYPEVRVAIELGGQDAKVIFFQKDSASGQLIASDMRMNGSCAGGTGAFIDQIAELLNIKTEEFPALAEKGNTLYDISGRCGVFAKTDIQPLLNQGVCKENIALSSYHAIAKQTIGGLAQGMEIKPPVIFEGGPLHFNPGLVKVFQERLKISPEQCIIPDQPETIVAHGAALSIAAMFSEQPNQFNLDTAITDLDHFLHSRKQQKDSRARLFFQDKAEKEAFQKAHQLPEFQEPQWQEGETVNAWLGIDSGSTTTKFVLLNEKEEMIYRFYSGNHGDPLGVMKYGLIAMRDHFREKKIKLNILGAGSTGYGENLFATAFKTDYHNVETVAHARAARKYAPDVSFILDIGGQDMKAINLKKGIVTGIVLNEACSAGCGSFIETYARSLGVSVEKIAEMAFRAQNPSTLGSRCTVFMNSSIITEQKNGRSTEDILAGICRSIIENVFTKVVRVPNLDALGKTIVVQGGTFKNDAVLRAFQQYTGKEVVRPPWPGEMGAIGIALLTKEACAHQNRQTQSSFLDLDNLEHFSFKKRPGLICPFCSNQCNRTVVEFSDGISYITGNRCEKGQIIGDARDPAIKEQLKDQSSKIDSVPDSIREVNRLLHADYPLKKEAAAKRGRIGIPVVLEYWNSLPFWTTFFRRLGYKPVLSGKSSYDLFESGLASVPSDTICFPAKLAHGHVQRLINKKVDRIFMPMMIRVPKENESAYSSHTCSIVQGYPLVIDHADEPEQRHGILFDTPVFHWYNKGLKNAQLVQFFSREWGLPATEIKAAIKDADKALISFRKNMFKFGQGILNQISQGDDFAVVLAGRPYHNDLLVNHDLARHFTQQGIAVLTLEALDFLHEADLRNIRMETTIPFHTRMIEAAVTVAENPNLELVQIVSFGCGHDAVISDEMQRVLKKLSDKELLVLKLDEGEARGPLNIRIKSFIETVRSRRKQASPQNSKSKAKLDSGFPATFTKEDKKRRTILAPNLSPGFTHLISQALRAEGYLVKELPLADERAIELGKKYVHNDICYPAQINIGEGLALLTSGEVDPDSCAMGLAKNCEDCRAGQYATLARKALDEAGFKNVPIITTGTDTKQMHPGFQLSVRTQYIMLWGLCLVDSLERMRREIRPYEKHKGETERVYNKYLKLICKVLPYDRRASLRIFEEAIESFNSIAVKEGPRKPRVLIIGEILLNYHPSSNGQLEEYLEENGMEVVLPSMLDFFRRTFVVERTKGQRGLSPNAFLQSCVNGLTEGAFSLVHKKILKMMRQFRIHKKESDIYSLIENIKDIVDVSYVVGEGWLLPAEIIEHAEEGVNSVVIVQPFGCLPNHITGRGLVKPIKKRFPHLQIISLDYDPDTSFANIENRLQMLIITAKELEKSQARESDNKQKQEKA